MEVQTLGVSKKNSSRLGAHIVFLDESGFLMLPTVVRTWAPRGKTPLLRHRFRRDKVSAISAISVSPKRQRVGLYYRLYQHNIKRVDVRAFLSHLLRHLRADVFVLLDRASIHLGPDLRQLETRSGRLHLEYFPGYAPELNPDEGVWCLLKRWLANDCPQDADDLQIELIGRLDDLRESPNKLRACIRHSGLPTFLR